MNRRVINTISIFYGLARLIFLGTIFIFGMFLTLLLMLVPLRTAIGMRLASQPLYWMAHLFLWTFNVQYHCPNPAMLRQHQGLILCNHLSYMDPIIPFAIAPLRFLGAAGVRRLPIINWIAMAVDTIYVNRGDKSSRSQARQEIADQLQAQPYPPLMLYPEGKISDGSQMFPFRHGSFEIVLEHHIPCLLCSIRYEPLSIVNYYEVDDTLPKAIWRLAIHRGPLYAELTPLAILETKNQDAATLAEIAHECIAESLKRPISSEKWTAND